MVNSSLEHDQAWIDSKQYQYDNNKRRIFLGEDSPEHWPADCLNVQDKIVLDLGCGGFGRLTTWQGQATSIHFLNHGAKKVIGVDISNEDIGWIQQTLISKYPQHESKYEFITAKVSGPSQIKKWIEDYNVDIVKSDTEGAEIHIWEMTDEDFNLVKEYYIETHTKQILTQFQERFIQCGYTVRDTLFWPPNDQIGLVFAYK